MAEPAAAKRGIPPKDDFNAWYPFMVEAAELVDKRYPIKGMDVWRPYGWKAMRLIDGLTHAEMERTGHQEVNFPLLVPEQLLEKENRLVSRLQRARAEGVDPSELRMDEETTGFAKEVYWVKHAGETELDVPMFLRPTSETAMYTMFPLWIRSHADLPLKTYQMVNTFRYETKQTRSFIRVREIHFFEAHTCHVDEDDATRQIEEDLEIATRLMHDLCLPVLVARRPVWDTFPGAHYTVGIDVVMPDGRTLQVASVHHYRDQWARAFDVRYEDVKGEQQYCHQTTYGMSERLLGAVVGVHGDDRGLILPPAIAPHQAVIVPVLAKKGANEVLAACNKLQAQLRDAGLRVHLDDRDLRPGQKYYDWEIRGVPLRFELGPRDLARGECVLVPRTGGKSNAPLAGTAEVARETLEAVADELRKRARKLKDTCMHTLPALERSGAGRMTLAEPVAPGRIYELPFDGSDADAGAVEELTGLSFLGDAHEPFTKARKCAVTGESTKRCVWLARTY
ncbi:MAG: aminoacyl--tRNA ligase-related protein [Candidatus Thermoplasmatota archaeon]|nr:aminoacyl--tRNA ligase-related protein [Candidatus Thermoplasmatota archaeon]